MAIIVVYFVNHYIYMLMVLAQLVSVIGGANRVTPLHEAADACMSQVQLSRHEDELVRTVFCRADVRLVAGRWNQRHGSCRVYACFFLMEICTNCVSAMNLLI
jgi:hypothetical protein